MRFLGNLEKKVYLAPHPTKILDPPLKRKLRDLMRLPIAQQIFIDFTARLNVLVFAVKKETHLPINEAF